MWNVKNCEQKILQMGIFCGRNGFSSDWRVSICPCKAAADILVRRWQTQTAQKLGLVAVVFKEREIAFDKILRRFRMFR